jgi:hypothetical protein
MRQPVAWWLFLSSATAAGFWLVGAIAPAQNGTMGSSESGWLAALSGSFGFAVLGLTTGRRLARKDASEGGVTPASRILLTLGMAGLVLIVGALVIGFALSIGSSDSFDKQAPPGLWFVGYAVAGAIGIGAGAAVPVRAVTSAPSTMAKWSLASGLVGLFLCLGVAVVPSVVAVVTGHLALRGGQGMPAGQADRDFARLGLVTGYLGLGLGLGLASWIGPAISG